MKKPFIFVLLLSFTIVLVPVISSLLLYKDKPVEEINNTDKKETPKEITYEKVDKDAPIINVYKSEENKVEKMNIEEYLYGVVSSEMPSIFNEEALKAQAIAARTYVMYKIEHDMRTGHANADICTDSTHCQAYSSYDKLKRIKGDKWMKTDYIKVQEAVNSTKGQILTYEDKAILPLYFSTSSGRTENSQDVFSMDCPYLVSVDSSYDKDSPEYISTCSIEKNKLIKHLKNAYPKLKISLNNLDKEINIKSRTEGGCVKLMQVGNIDISGVNMRKILNLNSANFNIKYNNDDVIFTVKGYGHGVGMSQWGAQGMAKKGYKYYDILFHYYKGTNIKDIY